MCYSSQIEEPELGCFPKVVQLRVEVQGGSLFWPTSVGDWITNVLYLGFKLKVCVFKYCLVCYRGLAKCIIEYVARLRKSKVSPVNFL